MTATVLVFNAGSSSIKYELIALDPAGAATGHPESAGSGTTAASGRPDTSATIASGLCERVGRDDTVLHHRVGDTEHTIAVAARDHAGAVRAVLDAFATHGPDLASAGIVGVGHRVVMGGDLHDPTLITDEVLAAIDGLAPLAPLHNPANAATIRIARELLGDVPHVAVFDTAFFHALPPAAAHYGIDPGFAAQHRIRRYGFHGISHEYVSRTVAERLAGADTARAAALRQIVLHLGNGASASAVVGGRPVETSMGLTPLEGLVMGTRSGDVDPAVAFYLHRELGMDIDAIDHLLNYDSGLRGMTGTNDMRDIRARVIDGDTAARAAVDIYVHRLVKYVGAYAAVMGGLDALTFTAGVGENDAALRVEVCAPLGFLGVSIDDARNDATGDDATGDGARVISPDGSPVKVLVVPTREEASIARQVVALLG